MTTAARTTELFPTERLAPTAALLHAEIALDRALTARAVVPAGLEPALADLMIRLSKAPGERLRGIDIGRQLMIKPARVSRLVDRAEAAGLVARQPDPDDRRAQQVTLTAEGRAKAEVFAPLMLEVLDSVVFDRFTPEELTLLVDLLTRLRDAAAELVAG